MKWRSTDLRIYNIHLGAEAETMAVFARVMENAFLRIMSNTSSALLQYVEIWR
jgi:hypothetical protein